VLGAMLLAGLMAMTRRRARLALGLAMLSVLVWAACGGGGMVSTGGVNGTPAGTSTLTVTGTYTTTPAETAAGAPSQVIGTTSLTLTVR
jgi:ABC-type glycerol-3-phosphate transport system substrate-binding protein